MPINADLLTTRSLAMIHNYVSPVPSFFRDRYFPTNPGDIFKSDEVLLERKRDNRKMADIVSKRVGDIPIDRDGYEIFGYKPPKVAPSRVLTQDVLEQRNFGEALYSDLTPDQRSINILRDDEQALERAIAFREEWLAVQVMLNNGFKAQSMIDDVTPGESLSLKFYEGENSPTVFTPEAAMKWGTSSTFRTVSATIAAACEELTKRGLPSVDLILGGDAAEVFLNVDGMMDRIDKNSGYITGQMEDQLTQYPGVTLHGRLNFRGHILNICSATVSYTAKDGTDTLFFPAKGVMITAPNSGRMLYAAHTQINHGSDQFSTIADTRVYKVIVDEENDTRKLRATSKPLPVPAADNPWMVCEDILA